MKPTPFMLQALAAAARQPLQRVHKPDEPGRPPWPANPCTLAALVRHELVERSERLGRYIPGQKRRRIEEWTITDAGRAALNPPPKIIADRDRYLDHRAGTTTNPKRSKDFEIGQVTGRDGNRRTARLPVAHVDPDTLDPRWRADAERRRVGAQPPRDRARQVRRQLRRAA